MFSLVGQIPAFPVTYNSLKYVDYLI